MSALTTVVGNLTAAPELRYTSGGHAVANLTVAVLDRVKDGDGWKDGKTWFARCTVWGELAEHAAAALSKGMRVIGSGRIEQRDWEDKDGNKRTSVEVILDALGPDLRYAVANVERQGAPAQVPADSWTGGEFGDSPF